MNLHGRSFLTLKDFTPEEISYLLDLAADLKLKKKMGVFGTSLQHKNIALIFEKPSTRTRCAFTVGCVDEGGHPEYLGVNDIQLGKKESVEDTARVLGRMFDGIEFRGFLHENVEKLAKYSGVPVWNGLTDDFHPTQMLADIMTVQENFGDVRGLKLVFMGDAGNNVGNSLMVVCAKLGMHFVACGPKELMPKAELVAKCKKIAAETGATIELTEDVKKGCKDADVIYTDIWLSMGEPEELWAKRIKLLKAYQVNKKVMSYAKPTAIFEHCLPSFHDRNTTTGEHIYEQYKLPEMEVADEVFLSDQSKVFDEAENRMHTIKAVMYATLK